MRVTSKEKLPEFQVIGKKLRIHFDYVEIPATEDKDSAWECEEAATASSASRDEIIEAIIQTKYPTYGAELAAIQNGGVDADEHQQFRSFAKFLADSYKG
jgi:hypothetical protein